MTVKSNNSEIYKWIAGGLLGLLCPLAIAGVGWSRMSINEHYEEIKDVRLKLQSHEMDIGHPVTIERLNHIIQRQDEAILELRSFKADVLKELKALREENNVARKS